MSNLMVERYYPAVVALIAAIAWYVLGFPFPQHLDSFLSAALTFSAILIGFLSIIPPIVMGLSGKSIVSVLRSSGYMRVLIRYLWQAIYGLLFFAIFNLFGFFYSIPISLGYQLVWVIACAYSLMAFCRMVSLLLKMLQLQ